MMSCGWQDVGRCGEVLQCVEKCGEVWRGVRCGVMWGDVGMQGEGKRGVGGFARCGEVWEDVGRLGRSIYIYIYIGRCRKE